MTDSSEDEILGPEMGGLEALDPDEEEDETYEVEDEDEQVSDEEEGLLRIFVWTEFNFR